MEQTTVAIVDDIVQTRQDISRLLYFEKDIAVIGEAGNGNEAIALVEHSKPDVVLMDINMPGLDGIRATEEITARYPNTAIIIISIQGEQEYLKKAMMAGAREYLIKPFSGDELANTIRQVSQIAKRRAAGDTGAMPPSTPRRAKVVSVFSGKGGSGKSFLAVNLSVVLSRAAKVAVMDLDIQFGDVAVMFGLSPKRTLEQLMEEEKLDWDTLQGYLVPHLSGVQVLPGVGDVGNSEKVDRASLEKIISCLRERFDYIILDLSTGFNDINLMAMDTSDLVLQVVTPDLPSLKSAIGARAVFDGLGYLHKVQLVQNLVGRTGSIKTSAMAQNLECSPVVSIPYEEKTVLSGVNKGVPPALTRLHTGLNEVFGKLGMLVSGNSFTNPESPGLLKKIFSF